MYVHHHVQSAAASFSPTDRRGGRGLLHLAAVAFLPASDPRIRGTIAVIERQLVNRSGLVSRHETEAGIDGLPSGEGAFLACTFWLADNYVLQGRLAEGRTLFESLPSSG